MDLEDIIVNEIKHSINICDKELNKEKDTGLDGLSM